MALLAVLTEVREHLLRANFLANRAAAHALLSCHFAPADPDGPAKARERFSATIGEFIAILSILQERADTDGIMLQTRDEVDALIWMSPELAELTEKFIALGRDFRDAAPQETASDAEPPGIETARERTPGQGGARKMIDDAVALSALATGPLSASLSVTVARFDVQIEELTLDRNFEGKSETDTLRDTLADLRRLSSGIRVLSMNATIEAARSGTINSPVNALAEDMCKLSDEARDALRRYDQALGEKIGPGTRKDPQPG